MNLADLPNEILDQILGNLDCGGQAQEFDRSALCAVALVSRRFTHIVQNILVRHLGFELYRTSPVASVNFRLKHFLLACTLNRYLVDLIQTVEVRVITNDYELGPADTKNVRKLYKVIASAKSLSRLTIGPSSSPLWHVFPLSKHSGFENLKFLSLASYICNSISADQVAHFCRLPKLEEFALDTTIIRSKKLGAAPEISSHSDKQTSSTTGTASSVLLCNQIKLRRLTLWTKTVVHPDALTFTLPYAGQLLALRLKVRGICRYDPTLTRRKGQEPNKDLAQPLKAGYIQSLLVPVKSSLQDLRIDSKGIDFSYHDGSSFDASCFLHLRNLSIGSQLLFGESYTPWHRKEQTEFIWERLPSSIEKLEIVFDGDQSILCSLHEMRETLTNGANVEKLWNQLDGSADVTTTRLRWLTEILERKSTQFQLLSQVRVHETCYHMGNYEWKIIEWPQRENFRKICQRNNIELSIRLRVPMEWKMDVEIIEG